METAYMSEIQTLLYILILLYSDTFLKRIMVFSSSFMKSMGLPVWNKSNSTQCGPSNTKFQQNMACNFADDIYKLRWTDRQ